MTSTQVFVLLSLSLFLTSSLYLTMSLALYLLVCCSLFFVFFFFQAEDGIRDLIVTGVQTCALPICCAALYIPDQELATSAARAVLPKQVPFADAVHNLGRSALLVAALTEGKLEQIGRASCRERV